MGLYLCVFADDDRDEELDGVEVGSYADFGGFRTAVAERLEGGVWGARFPTLMTHHDSDGVWSGAEAAELEQELRTIADELGKLDPVPFPSGWQAGVARSLGLSPKSLLDTFIDIDGEPLMQRLIGLAQTAQQAGVPIWFQ